MCSTYSLVAPNWQLTPKVTKNLNLIVMFYKAFLPIFTKALAVELSDFK